MSPRTGARVRRDPLSDDERRADALAIVRRFKQDMGRFPAHVHFDFAERFEVLSGVARAALGGDDLLLSTAEGRSTLYVPPGVPHVNPYNEERTYLELRQVFLPATDGAWSYVETLAAIMQDGRDDGGELPWPLLLAVADVTGERSYLTPVVRREPRATTWSFALQRRVLQRLGNVVAGTGGYDVHLGSERDAGQVRRGARRGR